jgi:hypothetical protein
MIRGGYFACASMTRCIIVAGGAFQSQSIEVYNEALGKWLRLPCNLPHAGEPDDVGSAVL